jgi:hypothetical protein
LWSAEGEAEKSRENTKVRTENQQLPTFSPSLPRFLLAISLTTSIVVVVSSFVLLGLVRSSSDAKARKVQRPKKLF